MRHLSISKAWDETRAILGRDGQLMMVVAAALIALPAALQVTLNPDQAAGTPAENSGLVVLLSFVAAIITFIGTLAITHLALSSGSTVAEAIRVGARRFFPVFVAALLWVIPMMLLFMLVLGAMVGPEALESGDPQQIGQALDGTELLVLLFLMLAFFYVGVRMFLITPVAVAEKKGPVAILKKSWQLTSGHFWRLFALLLMFAVAAMIVLITVGVMIGLLTTLAFGEVTPWSLPAALLGLFTGFVQAALTVILMTMSARIYAHLAAEPTVPHASAD
ncbi:glycerophosphoryl diester phosphodiesterase membrane domain-containing protein [Sphingomicrobium lutaoense]|uniref:Glycerophosphoryl diester phosphodiesterase membrane domain-containing protein n=1 Tax=Sphingomicrobium lutaoense TaxID=515949 RepID=A0A839YXS8_9SPHN|nr:glycerophosphoryl diester phosphodiesterase membrane domain-containing protein [Sphingomicrobium lutaoense]MBB3763979.1 hypothetical protein [Sphingomicrobium lutaoense]